MKPTAGSVKIKSYSDDIVGGSLLILESLKIPGLLIENADNTTWYQAIVVDNVLQKEILLLQSGRQDLFITD